MTGYLWHGQPGLQELNAQIMAERGSRQTTPNPHGAPPAGHGINGYMHGCRCHNCSNAHRVYRWRLRQRAKDLLQGK